MQLCVSQGKQDRYIPPLCLQLLIENAIKHNIASSRKPLLISISIDKEENLVVSNTLQVRKTPNKGAGIGLSNIAKRYENLSDKRISIEQSQGLFIVKLPLLELERI